MDCRILSAKVQDVRFPTSLAGHGSDAVHTDPDYSCAYVTLKTDRHDLFGYGLTFTCGKGTEIVVTAINSLKHVIEGKTLQEITDNFAAVYRSISSHPQIRWIGPEKGAVQLATAALLNAVWDLWARVEGKPFWKLLADMEPEKLVSTIDFRYIDDFLTPEKAIEFLREAKKKFPEREKEILARGVPAYTTSVGWVGYTDEERVKLCRQAVKEGYSHFKVKTGVSLEDDRHRLSIVRKEVGNAAVLMTDSNQAWGVNEAVIWMSGLLDFKPYWIEEPTSPDDILGHAAIAKELNPMGIKVATGEMIANRVMFKQFLQAGALQVCQIDSCRVGGPNEVLAIILMASQVEGVDICPHAGGVGLCELVQHYSIWEHLLNGYRPNKVCEYVDHLHEHFTNPTRVTAAHYRAPLTPGFSSQMLDTSLAEFEYPTGIYWNMKRLTVSQQPRQSV